MTAKKVKIRQNVKESPKIRGVYAFTVLDCATKKARQICDEIKRRKTEGMEYTGLLQRFLGEFSLGTVEFHNLVPDAGLEVIAENLSNPSPSAAYDPNISYIAVGTGTTAAAAGDTTLETEVFRDAVDTYSRSGKISKNAILIGYSEANGYTISEVGAFAGAASATADTGALMSRSKLTTTIAKDASKAVFVEISHTLANG